MKEPTRDEFSKQIAVLQIMEREIAQIGTISEAKEARDKAEALRAYAKSTGQLMVMQNQCAEMRLRLERRTGELLIEFGTKAGNPNLRPETVRALEKDVRDLGVSKDQASKWQRIARIPFEKFEEYLGSMRDSLKEITTAGALRLYHEAAGEREKRRILRTKPSAVTRAGQIIHGRMEEVLVNLSPRLANLIVTDPPYGLGQTAEIALPGREAMSKSAGEWDDPDVVKQFPFWADAFWFSLHPEGSIYCFVCDRYIVQMWAALEKRGFTMRGLLIWRKTDPPPSVRKSAYRSDVEYIIYATAGKTFTFNFLGQARMRKSREFGICRGKERLDHPTQKPVALLREYIEASSNPKDLVLDPFAGVGSTGAAAAELGRRYILVERSEYNYKQACLRLQDAIRKPERVF